MPVINHTESQELANQARLRISHFARGTFPEADGKTAKLPVNRFFMPVANPHGNACHIADEKRLFTLKPGCAYFIPAYHPAAVKLDPKLVFLSIQFRLELIEGVDIFSRCSSILEIADRSFLRRAQRAFDDSTFAAAAGLHAVTMDFCRELLTRLPGPLLQSAVDLAGFADELQYLRTHGNALTTVEELAARRGLARETFSRKFAAAAGMPPKVFLNRMLVNRASEMLRRSDLRISDIAERLGFVHTGYFARFFRKQTGVSPKEFRNRP